jgi:MFS family permease
MKNLETVESLVLNKPKISRELKLFITVTLLMGIGYSLVDSTFNNFLDAKFALSGLERAGLEFPREFPGFLVAFVSAALWFLSSRRLAVVGFVLGAFGIVFIGFASQTYGLLILWLFFYSLGQHVIQPLSSSIGMELAKQGQTGKRLGQMNALRNLATIAGSLLVFVGFSFFHFTYELNYLIAAVILLLTAVVMLFMKAEKVKQTQKFLKFYPEYKLYYFLSILFGSRKQIFLTFAPWVLVKIYHQPPQTLATLFFIGAVIGIAFQPFLGWMIDKLGEKFVLICEAVTLIFVCIGYGFAPLFLPLETAFFIACACFLLDQMLMSVNMARATYMKKIALDPSHVQPSLTLSVTIDHIFSISIALLGGLLWNDFGYSAVFLLGTGIAAVNIIAASKIKLPGRHIHTDVVTETD